MPAAAPPGWRAVWVALIVAGVICRIMWLGTVPGINGDECWFGIQAYRLFHGDPVQWSALPTSRPLFSPILWSAQIVPTVANLTAFFWLRLPTCVASILTLVVVGRYWEPLVGATGCRILVLLLAVSPPEIMFARFGMDPSLMSFCQACLIATIVQRRWILAVLALLLGVITHPQFLLSLPVAALLLVWQLRPRWVPGAVRLALAGAGAAVLLRYCVTTAGLDPERIDFPRFCAGIVDLLNGEASFAYLVDPARAQLGTLLATLCGVVLVLAMAWRGFRDVREFPEQASLAAGTCLMVAGLFLAIGTHAIVPPQERNSLGLTIFVLAWLAAQLARSPLVRRPLWLTAVVLVLSGVLLARVAHRYLWTLRHHGSSSHRAFMSAPVEPRQQAFEQARAWLGPSGVIIAADWWIFHPITYLAQPKRILVVHPDSVQDLRLALQAGCVVVVHSHSPMHQTVAGLGLPLRQATVRQAGGREVLHVFALATAPGAGNAR